MNWSGIVCLFPVEEDESNKMMDKIGWVKDEMRWLEADKTLLADRGSVLSTWSYGPTEKRFPSRVSTKSADWWPKRAAGQEVYAWRRSGNGGGTCADEDSTSWVWRGNNLDQLAASMMLVGRLATRRVSLIRLALSRRIRGKGCGMKIVVLMNASKEQGPQRSRPLTFIAWQEESHGNCSGVLSTCVCWIASENVHLSNNRQ